MNTPAHWTWLVYMAGDNNLEGAGKEDLAEMQQAGSTPRVNVLVQFDTEQNQTFRYRAQKNKLKSLQQLPGVDCGDPQVLRDFIQWGVRNYPAQHYLIDIWNHGSGWENLPPDYDYDSIRAAKPRQDARIKRLKRALFRTSIAQVYARTPAARAIAIDCGSHDYLDNQELHQALLNALPNGQKVDILGCDACLMNMLEIGFEMKDTALFLVGSEETEPSAGWPYAAILKSLNAQPSMSPEELARCIVSEYGQSFQATGENITQSALDLGKIELAAIALDELAHTLLEDLAGVAGAVLLAREKAQKFAMAEYIDLGDFARQLIQRLPQHSKVKAAANKILQALAPKTGTGLVLHNVTAGPRVQRATGVSFYFPRAEDYAPDYASLTYSREGSWQRFLETLFKL